LYDFYIFLSLLGLWKSLRCSFWGYNSQSNSLNNAPLLL